MKDALIAEALQALSERKRNVILLSYFLEMSDADIAREMNLVRGGDKPLSYAVLGVFVDVSVFKGGNAKAMLRLP